MEKNIEKSIDKTLRKSSPARAWSILLLCLCCVAFATFIRFFVFSIWNFEGKIIPVCELAMCKKKSKAGDLLSVATKSGNSILLWQVGKSGDTIDVPTPFGNLIIEVPVVGDTIFFEYLHPMLWDAALALYKEISPKEKITTEISLWNMGKELPFSYVGRASISGRPVSEREVAFLPWQELRILELQLQKIFPVYDYVRFKRRLFADTLEIKSFVVDEELFYLSCEKDEQQKLCFDSRENGFFKKSEIQGIAF
ncbi:MAG: hypothetical protein FWF67_02775 [Fibromonadales bacterium]|nr:hypothetical protein [Fibromonadales bacterium]